VKASVRVGRDADGNVTVLLTAFIVVAMMLGGAVARLGGAVVVKSRASNAADAAALAAAGVLARGSPVSDACAVARTTAADNGARLETCRAAATFAEVIVVLHDARAQARAQFDAPVDGTRAVEGGAQSGIAHATPASGRIDP
jgi:secretion/DNA translocation related TadE-like protein